MNHLKLFEAFSHEEQVEGANNLFIEWRLFTSFLKLGIFVERNYGYTMFVFTFWRILGQYTCPETGQVKFARIEIFNAHHANPHLARRPRLARLATSRDLVEPTSYTEEYLHHNCHLRRKHASEISMNMNHPGIHRAATRYLDYLRNTPDKKHLLKE